jgi:hypothetical protein
MARALNCLMMSLGAALITPYAHADEPAPRWEVGEICAAANQDANCPRIESDNRRSLLLRWQAMPSEDRRACKAEVNQSGRLSYKQLLNCLEARQLKALDEGPQSAGEQHSAV